MKLSVIVPVYKAENYLQDCVDSILHQTMDDLELILINDGSPDNSGAIMAQYAAEYPDIVKTLTVDNGGQGRARNFGIDMARGDFLSFIDSDDWLEVNAFELMLAAADKENADIVVCDMEKRWNDGRREYVKAALQSHPLASAGSASNKIFRRSLVSDIRFPLGVWYEDFCFSAKLLMLSSKTVFVEKPLYIYRCGQESTMNNNNARRNLDILTVMDSIRFFAEEYGKKDDFEFMLINHVLLDAIKRVSSLNSPEKPEILAAMRDYVRKYIPRLSDCKSFREETGARRLVMRLNYYGADALALKLISLRN